MVLKLPILIVILLLSACGSTEITQKADTLALVQERGELICGVNEFDTVFKETAESGEISGLDPDTCRAIAAAILGDAGAVEFVKLNARNRFEALRNGKVDVLIRNTLQGNNREVTQNVLYAGVNFFDGLAFMVRRENENLEVEDLKSKIVCNSHGGPNMDPEGRTFLENAQNFSSVSGLDLSISKLSSMFSSAGCDALALNHSALFQIRNSHEFFKDFEIILPPVSKLPLGPFVRIDDPVWRDIVEAVINGLIEAERLGIDRIGAQLILNQKILAVSASQQTTQLPSDWLYNTVSEVGNYSELFEKNLTEPFGIPRSHNALKEDGGLR